MAPKSGRQTAEASEQTRQRIVESAMTVFSRKGFDGASLREISVVADVTHGLIRHHFGSKEDLWRAVVDAYVAKLSTRQQPVFEQSGAKKPGDLVRMFLRNYIEVSADHPEITRVILNDCCMPGPLQDYMIERTKPLNNAISQIFRAAQSEGLLQKFSAENFLLFMVSLGSIPFALEEFTNRLTGRNAGESVIVANHIDLVIDCLLGEN